MTTITPAPPRGTPERVVPTRRISFEESLRDLPRHFAADGDLITSHVIAALSAVFPDGEDFFVRSVRRYRDRVTDPELRRQVAGFIGQEAMHGREHRAFNARLGQLGYPTQRVERVTRWILTNRERLMTDASNLALTAALEHFTATLAELVLTDEDVRRRMGHRAVRDLFVWHALEEAEHKAVAFDVYRAVGGSERTRVITMKGIRIGFIGFISLHVITSLLADRETYRRGVLRRSWRNFSSSPLADVALWRKLRLYDRRGFHPDQIDTDELVSRWREELFGEDGSLNDLLVRPKAG